MSQEKIELGTCQQCDKPDVEIFLSSKILTEEDLETQKPDFTNVNGSFSETKKRCSCCLESENESFQLWDPKYHLRSKKDEAAA